MTPSLLFPICLLVAFSFFPKLLVAAATGSACSSGIYQELLFLSKYAPAESYCSAHYPLPIVTVTATAGNPKERRLATTTTATTTKTSTSPTTKATGTDAIWSSLLSSAKSIIATVCSCIETPSTKTVTVATTKSSKTSTTSSKSTSKSKSTSTSTTTTSTTTPTATACNPGGAQPTFLLKASAPGTLDDGRYAVQSNTGGNDIVTFIPDTTGATRFSFDAACHLLGLAIPGTPEIANIDAGATNETVYFNTAAQIAQASNPAAVAATCNIANGGLKCTDQTATILFVCTNQLQLQIGTTIPQDFPIGGPAGSTSGPCELIALTPVYV